MFLYYFSSDIYGRVNDPTVYIRTKKFKLLEKLLGQIVSKMQKKIIFIEKKFIIKIYI
jgi:hypothetical protein